MADVFTAAKRSEVMSRIRSRGNRDTELRMIALLRDHRITDWRRGANLPSKPDFVFRSARVAVFVDGCFWHGCPYHGHTPRSNKRYWVAKLARNKARDRAINRELRTRGWAVLRVWECALTRKRETATLRRLAAAVMKRNLFTVHRTGGEATRHRVVELHREALPGRTGVRARAFKAGLCTPKRSIGKLTKPSDRAGDPSFTR